MDPLETTTVQPNPNPASLDDTMTQVAEPGVSVRTSQMARERTQQALDQLNNIRKREEENRVREEAIRAKNEEVRSRTKIDTALADEVDLTPPEVKSARMGAESIDNRVRNLMVRADPVSASYLQGLRDIYVGFVEELNNG